MQLLIIFILGAFILGGFVGGEMTGRDFSITGAVISSAIVFAVIFGLGWFFYKQDRKHKKVEVSPEMREVFDRMFADKNLQQQRSKENKATQVSSSKIKKGKHKIVDDYLALVNSFFYMMVPPNLVKLDDAYEKIISNKKAMGYLYGVHFRLFMRTEIKKCTALQMIDILDLSYQDIFGFVDGYNLFTDTATSIKDDEFQRGQLRGILAVDDYMDKDIYPADFYSILGYGYLD